MINSTKVRDHKMFSLKKFVVLAGALLLCAQVTHAQAIYFENFGNVGTPIPNAIGGNTNLEQSGWSGAWGPTAIDSAASSGGVNNFGISSQVGSPTNPPTIAAAPPSQHVTHLESVRDGAHRPGLPNPAPHTPAFPVDPPH